MVISLPVAFKLNWVELYNVDSFICETFTVVGRTPYSTTVFKYKPVRPRLALISAAVTIEPSSLILRCLPVDQF